MTQTEAMYLQYRSAVGRLPHLDAKAAQALAWRIWLGDDAAKQELVERHLWLVIEMVEQLRPWRTGATAALMGAGNCVLVKATEQYRPWQDGDFAGFARDMLLKDLAEGALPAA